MVISKDSSDPFTTLFIVVIKLIKLMVAVVIMVLAFMVITLCLTTAVTTVITVTVVTEVMGVIEYFEIEEDFTKHFNMFRLDQENLDPVNHYLNRYLLLDSGQCHHHHTFQ